MSPKIFRPSFVTTLAVLPLLAAIACGPGSPEQKIADIRSNYTVELNSWRALEPEPVEAALDEMAEEAEEAAEAVAAAAADAADADGASTGEGEEEEIETGPREVDVLFDLVVLFRGRESLDGITVDVTHADASQTEKDVHRQYIDTAGIISGETRQVDFVLEDVELEEGDAFAVQLVSGIPGDLGEYREFSQ